MYKSKHSRREKSTFSFAQPNAKLYISRNFSEQIQAKIIVSNFFFLISKKIILKNHKKTKTAHRLQRGEQKRKKKRKEKNNNTRKPTKTNYKEEN